MLFIPLTLALLSTYSKATSNQVTTHQESVLFIDQLEKEVRESDTYVLRPREIEMTKNGQRIRYQLYQSRIRRQVNQAGHEIVLQNVDSIAYSLHPKGITIFIQSGTYSASYLLLTKVYFDS
ncbi:ComGF family competence protein [Paenalkalicoccus suaedae]|uniref:ComGF family competence protein n=2 Tax=Paenalkalicoccus suaedae TaxID=2592382 RepID=A0A859FDX8_9BACI|nr:ComGF family competence protein [Paenalkalicoccus suaedae]